MKKAVFFLATLIIFISSSCGQWSQQARDSINKLSYADHQLMMKQLGITDLCPGPTWQEQLLEQGWGYAILVPTSYQAYHGSELACIYQICKEVF